MSGRWGLLRAWAGRAGVVDPLRFAVLLPALWAAHNVADHVVRTDHQAADKAASWSAMAGHVGGYQVVQAARPECGRVEVGGARL